MSRYQSDRGAILIHVGIGIIVLLGFSAFAVDYGLLMVSRNQAQAAADAAALSGASSLAFDGTMAGDRWDRARNVAWNAGHQHAVWGQAPGVVPASPYGKSPYSDDTNIVICKDLPEACVRVDVYRDGTNGSAALPVWFASLFNVTSQRVRAMAVAQAAPASGTDCLKPWLIPDRWNELAGAPGEFDPGDTYTSPTMDENGEMNYGSGWTPEDIGTTLLLTPGNPHQAISPSDFYEIEEAALYEEAIYGCEITGTIGQPVTALPGHRVGPTGSGLEMLLNLHNGGPVTVIIGMFDPAAFAAQPRTSGTFPLQIVNMLAFSIVRQENNGDIYGTIVGAPSEQLTICTAFPCPTSTGLVSVIRLVR